MSADEKRVGAADHAQFAQEITIPTPFFQETAMLSRFAPQDDDVHGLLAFTLHRRTLMEWVKAFEAREKRPPNPEEMHAFLLGEAAPRRIDEYRAQAARMLEASARPESSPQSQPAPTPNAKPRKSMIWPFGPGLGMVVEQPDTPINWKGLLLRLLFLMLAVIATALMLRFFVVKS